MKSKFAFVALLAAVSTSAFADGLHNYPPNYTYTQTAAPAKATPARAGGPGAKLVTSIAAAGPASDPTLYRHH